MARPSVRAHTDAVKTTLAGLGVTVGDAQAPSGSPPYCVLYPIMGGTLHGPLAAQYDDGELVYQVTCVGVSREQTEWLVDKVMGLLSGVTVSGRSVPIVDVEAMPGIQRDDNVSPPLYWATPRFRLFTTPS